MDKPRGQADLSEPAPIHFQERIVGSIRVQPIVRKHPRGLLEQVVNFGIPVTGGRTLWRRLRQGKLRIACRPYARDVAAIDRGPIDVACDLELSRDDLGPVACRARPPRCRRTPRRVLPSSQSRKSSCCSSVALSIGRRRRRTSQSVPTASGNGGAEPSNCPGAVWGSSSHRTQCSLAPMSLPPQHHPRRPS